MKRVKSCGIHSSHKNLTIRFSFSSSSFQSKIIGAKFCTINDKISIMKLSFKTFDCLNLLYETFVNRFLDLTFVLL